MKKFIIYSVAAAAFVLGSCSSDEPFTDTTSITRISLSDAGYPGNTRSQESGMTTLFTAGDKAGLFAVTAAGVVTGMNNVCLTAVTQGDDISWSLPAGVTLPSGEGVKFFCYYPYRENLPAAPDFAAATAPDFFAATAAAWTVEQDQSSHDAFTASDLMTAEGSVADGTLNFNMFHRMTLVRIVLPSTRYVFTNQTHIPDYVTERPLTVRFNGFTPYEQESAIYSYIVNAAKGDVALAGSYYNDGKQYDWHIAPPVIPGTATTYNIDRAKSKVISHELAVGDFLLSNGNLLSKDAPAAEVAAADVVGVIYNIDPARIGDAEKQALGGVVHASVFHVDEMRTAQYDVFAWGPKVEETGNGLSYAIGANSGESFTKCDADISGYGIMQAIKKSHPDNYSEYEAFEASENFGKDHANYSKLAAVSTGWYMPSAGQWFDILRNLGKQPLDNNTAHGFMYTTEADLFCWKDLGNMIDNINASMAKVNSATKKDLIAPSNWYWCASQSSYQYAYLLQINNGNLGTVNSFSCFGNPKSGWNRVRVVLTF